MNKITVSRHQALGLGRNASPGPEGAIIARILIMPDISLTVELEIASSNIGPFCARPETRAIQ